MTDLTELKGIGEKSAKLYSKLGINTVEDALFYFPRDYITYEELSDCDKLECEKTIAFEAVVMSRPLVRRIRKLSITTAKLSAGNNLVTATWFNMPYMDKVLKTGNKYVIRGTLTVQGDHYHIEHPKVFTPDDYRELLGHINPVYSLTKGLSNNSVTTCVKRSFELVGDGYRRELYDMHFPKDEKTLIRARGQLVYEEFLDFILRLRLMKEEGENERNDFDIIDVAECNRLIESLPYRLTDAQKRVWDEIREDLAGDKPMRRLIQGDVGSGKTVIAILAAVMTGICGYQTAIMAPTEILADQHYNTVKAMLAKADISLEVVLLTGSMTEAAKKNVRQIIKSGRASIIIGTHALFYEKVIYNDLALVITDEQHRFGVSQRTMLSEKNSCSKAHVLVMSATPIPRTLAIILYGDLSISVIDEVPAHKKPIKNAVVDESYRKTVYKYMDAEIKAHHQVYVICPLIEESDAMDVHNVVNTAKELRAVFDESVRIGVLHGRMKAAEKQKVMDSFSNGSVAILVSTTVVEVGVNVPNATFMLIENSERFGLAALHQLRGRIGRGSDQSYCIFMSASKNPDTKKRLEILKTTNDGFEIASEDMKMRGPGDMFGIRQSGEVSFRLGDIFTDAAILKKASDDATRILGDDADLSKPENALLRKRVFAENRAANTASTI